ncbi:MAG: hypothetical protein Q7T87_06610 [Polaromonas sp.]|nr:hypothetical protein [Polaromonas sp.]
MKVIALFSPCLHAPDRRPATLSTARVAMLRATRRIALALTVATSAFTAQAAALAVDTLTVQSTARHAGGGGGSAPGRIEMPFVKSSDVALARRINHALFIQKYLALAPDKPQGRVGRADGVESEGVEYESFEMLRNDGRVFSLAFEGDSCGAYCEEYRSAYAFDARQGWLLTPENLFTPAGLRAVADRMARKAPAQYRAQLRTLAAELRATQKSTAPAAAKADRISDIEERIAFNETCLEERAQATDADPALFAWELHTTTLRITTSRCSNHAMRALDDVGAVTWSPTYAQLAPWLTAYGKQLLTGAGDGGASPAETLFEQVLYGELVSAAGARLPITAWLSVHKDGSVSGTYFYDRMRRPIELMGRWEGDWLVLGEQAGDAAGAGGSKAVFRLQRMGSGGFVGRWEGAALMEVRLGR